MKKLSVFVYLFAALCMSLSALPNASDYEIYDHNQVLEVQYDWLGIKVFDEPGSSNLVYEVQKGDKITISKLWYSAEKNCSYLEAEVSNGKKGFITLGKKNPYKNGEFKNNGSITVYGNQIGILLMKQTFVVSEETEVKEKPYSSSNTVHVLNHKEAGESYKSSAITSDYKWVKILFNGFSGWVPADALSVDRGGPVIETPESIVRFELIDGNLI
ncbi:MAG: hypothetical protein MJ185_07350 [Treponema sp.]|nr:hypothetical protein [Treponema sp.]